MKVATGIRKDPYTGYRFQVEIEGIIVGGFTEVSGIQAETSFEVYREGGVNDFVYKLPKGTEYPNLVLKRGVSDSDALFKWHREIVNGTINPKSVSVILLDSDGSAKWRWNFYKVYPVKWIGPELRADSNTVAVESIELVYRGFEKG